MLSTMVGTLYYAAPEVLQEKKCAHALISLQPPLEWHVDDSGLFVGSLRLHLRCSAQPVSCQHIVVHSTPCRINYLSIQV